MTGPFQESAKSLRWRAMKKIGNKFACGEKAKQDATHVLIATKVVRTMRAGHITLRQNKSNKSIYSHAIWRHIRFARVERADAAMCGHFRK
ncbi:hypothetical protein [Paraburkholderia kururiensis]|uniref:hypothetical protein n=1 Tax=Paraburkholderia kururiensis TaxID=984307 RepID=UPI0012E06A09|nr:hypothetical protein [Paraburkholderia kururiensis]